MSDEERAAESTSKLVPSREVISGAMPREADFISYIVAGLLLGLFFDWLLGTRPVMTIIWSLLGFGVGFYRLWVVSAKLEDDAERRGYGA